MSRAVESELEESSIRLTREWDARGIDVATLEMDAKGTIVPMGAPKSTRFDDEPTAVHDADGDLDICDDPSVADLPLNLRSGVTKLPLFALTASELRVEPDVVLEGVLGEGGMGTVFSARQPSLRRDVAVKTIRDGAPRTPTIRALLREARVTGTLEHPNIVPIHTLGRDDEGRPLIVMKRIEGTSWADLLIEQHREGPHVVMAQLEHHINVLVAVAKAVHFAHSRGIIHRDVKPDNVMIGGFGEVYVVDWGIAACTRPREDLDLPVTTEIKEVTGSPAYMAPEMAAGDGNRIDPRSDVYLLGSTLHEILTGRPPHHAATTEAMLTRAYASSPHTYDAAVPVGLGEICRHAMARKPEDRFQTAAAFAAALQRFLKHRNSEMLEAEANASFEALREALSVTHDGSDSNNRIYYLFNECRFGFASALKIWENNERAQNRLQEALELMIEHELASGSGGAAQALLSELPKPNPQLADRVEQRIATARHTEHELTALRIQVDPTRSDRTRAYTGLVVAATWALIHAGLHYIDLRTLYAVGHYELMAVYGLYTVGTLAAGLAQRETLLASGVSGLKTQLSVAIAYATFTALWPVCAAADVNITESFQLMFFVGSAIWLTTAITVDRRLLSWGLAMLAGLVVSLIDPRWTFLTMGGAGFVAATALSWMRLRTRHPDQSLPLSARWE